MSIPTTDAYTAAADWVKKGEHSESNDLRAAIAARPADKPRLLDLAVDRLAFVLGEGAKGDSTPITRHYEGAEKNMAALVSAGDELSDVSTDRLAKEIGNLEKLKALCQTQMFGAKAKTEALWRAVRSGKYAAAEFLLAGLDSDARKIESGETLLMQALIYGRGDVVRLLWKDADLRASTKKGTTLVDAAVIGEMWDQVLPLVEAGVRPNRPATLCKLAENKPELVLKLTKFDGIDWNQTNSDGTNVMDVLGKSMAEGSLRQIVTDDSTVFQAWKAVAASGGKAHTCTSDTFWRLVNKSGSCTGELLSHWTAFDLSMPFTKALLYNVGQGDHAAVQECIKLLQNEVDGQVAEYLNCFKSNSFSGDFFYAAMQEHDGRTALMLALSQEKSRVSDGIVDALMEVADVALRGPGDKTTFEYALDGQRFDYARKLYREHKVGFGGEKPLERAKAQVRPGNEATIRVVVELGLLSRADFLSAMMALDSKKDRQKLVDLEAELFPSKADQSQ